MDINNLPDDIVLFISGSQSVGKTSAAYKLMRAVPKFERIFATSMMSRLIGSVVRDISHTAADGKAIYDAYKPIFEHITYGDLAAQKAKAGLLVKYVREMTERQQSRKMPTIFEGEAIVPSLYFDGGKPVDGFGRNIVFVNLFVSDEDAHAGTQSTASDIHQKVKAIRLNKAKEMHEETLALAESNKNVFSLDITELTEDEVVDKIKDIILNECVYA